MTYYQDTKKRNNRVLIASGIIGFIVGAVFNIYIPNGEGFFTGFGGGVVTLVTMLGLYGLLRR